MGVYPKSFMTLTELAEMGLPRDYLNQMAHRKNQNYCTRMTNKKKSKFLFDTKKFEDARERMLVR